MPAIVNVGDFVKVAVMAFAFILIANRGLTMAGLSEYKA